MRKPLYVPRVSVNGAMHDVVVVATEHDSIYAFDAAGRGSAPLWQTSLIDPAHGITTMPCTSPKQPECDPTILAPEQGITATPVIDPATQTVQWPGSWIVASTNSACTCSICGPARSGRAVPSSSKRRRPGIRACTSAVCAPSRALDSCSPTGPS